MGSKSFVAVFAGFHSMEFFLVLFLEVDVIHLSASAALFDIPTAISEVSCDLGFWEVLQAVVAALHRFVIHRFRILFELLKSYISLKGHSIMDGPTFN